MQEHGAQASSIRVRASTTTGTLDLEIADDGIGGATERAGGGLLGLRDRVEALGGIFNIDSPSGHGTRIAAAIPVTPAAPLLRGMGYETKAQPPASDVAPLLRSRSERLDTG